MAKIQNKLAEMMRTIKAEAIPVLLTIYPLELRREKTI
jgi:hypothetical protein